MCRRCHVSRCNRGEPRQRGIGYRRKPQAHRIKRLPIVEDGRLVGIVSRRDILGLIIDAQTAPLPKEDESIRLAVRTRLRSDLGITPQKVQVTVKNGQVTLDGNVESELKQRLCAPWSRAWASAPIVTGSRSPG